MSDNSLQSQADAPGQFRPAPWLRPAAVQTALASSRLRSRHCKAFGAGAKRLVLEQRDGLKTTCYVNDRADARAMIVLLHGWLGTPGSSYVLSAARALYDAGFATARLTLPDHGEAALMNERVVNLTQHEVLHDALAALARLDGRPIGLMGFSLGGNYALRIARDLGHAPLPGLRHVFAVSPVIDPGDTCDKVDARPLIRRYFLNKFARLYRGKQALYPDLLRADEVLRQSTVRAMTTLSVARWTGFDSAEAYFDGYRINRGDLGAVQVPVTLLTAQDDPIVSAGPAQMLEPGGNFERLIPRHGGHNGFFGASLRANLAEDLAKRRFAAMSARKGRTP